MHLDLMKWIFEIFGIIFVSSLILMNFLFFKNYRKELSKYVPVLAFMFILYLLLMLIIIWFIKGILLKVIMFILFLSPFIIGKLVSYKKLSCYSIIQILCVILSMLIVIII